MATRGKPRPSRVEQALLQLAGVSDEPRTAASRDRLLAALGSEYARVVSRAARLIADHRLEGFERALALAFERFLEDPVKRDPGCTAKVAVLEALDFVESVDPAPFQRAVRCFQPEPAWGPPVDTATGVRARGLLGLARLGHDELDLLAAECLLDPEVPVRQAALQALVHHAGRSGAALALYKLKLGDAEPMVTLEAMSALLSLAPAKALEELARLLRGRDEELQELAAVALGSTRGEGPLGVLCEALQHAILPKERALLYRGIGLHRSDRAMALLLEVVARGRVAEARAALLALGARRHDPGVEKAVRQAASPRAHELAAALAEAFPAER